MKQNNHAEWDESLHAPRDAANRRAHFEQTEQFNAFHDGLNSKEVQEAIKKARDKALAKMKKLKQ